MKKVQVDKMHGHRQVTIYFYLYFYLSKAIFYIPFFAVFFNIARGISNEWIIQLFAVYSIAKFILEVPTGFISDRYGEKMSLLFGATSMFVSMIFLSFGGLLFIFLGEILFAAGEAFCSGADQALVYHYYDNNKELFHDHKIEYDKMMANCISYSWLSISIASILGWLLASVNMAAPFYATMVSFALLIFIVTKLPSSSVKRQERLLPILIKSLDLIKSCRALTFWLIASSLFLSTNIAAYCLLQPYLNELKLAGPKNGLIYFLITIFAFISAKGQPYIDSKVIKKRILLLVICSLLCLTYLLFSKANTLITIIAVACLFRALWGFATPLFLQNLNHNISDNSLRSTVLSINSLMTSVLSFAILQLFSFSALSTGALYCVLAVITMGLILIVTADTFYESRIAAEQKCGALDAR